MSIQIIKREVTELKQRLNPEDEHFNIYLGYGLLSDPHGFLGDNTLHIVIKDGVETQWIEAWDAETELAATRKYYEDIIIGKIKGATKHTDFRLDSTHPFRTFESFVEYTRCTCGQHGADGQQPFLGDSQHG